jgi:intracellular septation protein
MTPPARTISAARRIALHWGLTGCSSKYWVESRGLDRAAPEISFGYDTRPFFPAGAFPAPMQALLEFAPLVAFFAAYYVGGVYVATGVLMGAMVVLLLVDYARQRRIPPMHGLSAVLVFAFGTATLLLHDQRFIQWKPTVFYWLAAVAFCGSFWIGKQTLAQRLLGSALPDSQIPQSAWRKLNAAWVIFDILLGVLNLLLAFNTSERTWVNFHGIGLTALTFVFVAGQAAWILRRAEPTAGSGEAST